MSDNLKDVIKSYYQSQSTNTDIYAKKSFKALNSFSLAALALAFCALIFFMRPVNYNTSIMKEIAYNHNKALEPEILSSELPLLQQRLVKLDFNIINSQKINSKNWQVIGARYCSIKGKIAAQIKLRNIKTNKTYTMYQAQLGKMPADSEYTSGNTTVKIWNEDGLLLGIAGPESLETL